MAIAAGLLTYGDSNRREDVVLNAIEILTAQENQAMNLLGKTKAIDTVHSFLVDSLLTPGSLAIEMGTDITLSTLTTPTRLTNLVQEIAKGIQVSRPQEAIQHYSGTNETERQLSKGLKDWGNAAEFDIVRSTLVSGISGTVAKMNGMIAAISKSTNTTAHTSGTVFSATILDGLMVDNWTNSNGDVATEVFVGGVMKRIMDSFTQKTNIVVNAPGITNIVKTVTTYETSMGTITIHKHRYVFVSGTDATNRILGFRPDKLKLAYLDMPYIKDLAEGGAYSKRMIYGSLTLEVRNQDSNFFASGFLLTA
jgi:Family of unknown function (DUF5309)